MKQLNSEHKTLTALGGIRLVFLALTLTLSLGAQAQHTFRGYSEFVSASSYVKCPSTSYKSFGAGCCPNGYAMGGIGVIGMDLLCRRLPALSAMAEYLQSGRYDAGGVVACHPGDYAAGHFYDDGIDVLLCRHSKHIRLGPATTEAVGTDGWHVACSQTAGAAEMVVVGLRPGSVFLCSAVVGWKTPK